MRSGPASSQHQSLTEPQGNTSRADLCIGLLIAAAMPALFWTAAFAGMANFAGYEIPLAILALSGLAIAGFLAAVISVLSAQPR